MDLYAQRLLFISQLICTGLLASGLIDGFCSCRQTGLVLFNSFFAFSEECGHQMKFSDVGHHLRDAYDTEKHSKPAESNAKVPQLPGLVVRQL